MKYILTALAAAVLGAAILAAVASIYVAREKDWRRTR